jgi:UDP-hydrolysing UDP-N-acetyl-D-glucosamine 2-epimerase
MRKICVVVASRANYARVKSVLKAVQAHPQLELQLVVGASALLDKYGSAIDIIRKDGFEPAATCYILVEGENPTTMAKSTGLAIIELATIFSNLRPDIVLTVADRYETLATAVAASYMNIPLAHTQGGDVTGTLDESVRHAVTRLAHIHFPASRLSEQRLIKMGEDPATIFMTGCPSIDLLHGLDTKMSPGFREKFRGVGPVPDFTKPYLVVMQHPVTTEFGKELAQIQETIKAVQELDLPTVWFWPNADAGSDGISKGLRLLRESDAHKIHFVKNLAPEEYARLIANCACLVGNSSSALREGVFLGVPAVNIGTRQQGRERGANVIDVPYEAKHILDAIQRQIRHGKYPGDHRFGDGEAGKMIAERLATVQPRIQKRIIL